MVRTHQRQSMIQGCGRSGRNMHDIAPTIFGCKVEMVVPGERETFPPISKTLWQPRNVKRSVRLKPESSFYAKFKHRLHQMATTDRRFTRSLATPPSSGYPKGRFLKKKAPTPPEFRMEENQFPLIRIEEGYQERLERCSRGADNIGVILGPASACYSIGPG